ncbi:MAG: hemerythrin domain-containing protein [SAR202 cluster bacterium]|jgi:hypothetical protein|nr:hemerythrin domain-containing protein [SAR202 cluster bacterium]|tara:strand:+ start:2694 stop:3398 length:705 start_codon:yes stop_codon:yes gene_type:complete
MAEDITKLDAPIDVMYMIHKAFRAQSERAEDLAAKAQDGGDLGDFMDAFNFWVQQLLYHAQAEDDHMTGPLTDSQPARDNETEHDELRQQGGGLIAFLGKGDAAGLEENVAAAMAALEDQQHKDLAEKAAEVEAALTAAMGEERVLARTRRHLYRRVMALRVLEYDHFENEEAFVVESIAENLDESTQLTIAKHLLIDSSAEDTRWVIDWVARELAPGEQKLLVELEARLTATA